MKSKWVKIRLDVEGDLDMDYSKYQSIFKLMFPINRTDWLYMSKRTILRKIKILYLNE